MRLCEAALGGGKITVGMREGVEAPRLRPPDPQLQKALRGVRTRAGGAGTRFQERLPGPELDAGSYPRPQPATLRNLPQPPPAPPPRLS